MNSTEVAAAIARLSEAHHAASGAVRSVERLLRRATDHHQQRFSRLTSEPATRGGRSVRLGHLQLHSSVDPRREAARYVGTLEGPAAPDALISFGFGAGHYLSAARERWPGVPMLVVVPNPVEILLAALEDPPDWWATLAPIEFVPAAEVENAVQLLQSAGHRAVIVVSPRPFREAYPDDYALFERTVTRYRRRVDVNSNTVRRFGRRWVANLLDNAFSLGRAQPIERLFAHFHHHGPAALPVIVCGAGPTLEQAIAWLPAARDHALLIAVDTAAARLIRAGVRPDLVVVVDPQYWNTRHLDLLFDRNLPLVTEPAVHPRVVRRWRGAVFTAASLFPLGRLLYSTGHMLGAGGSVATSAWDLARVLGGSPIYLCGVDLGFPNGDTHCRDSFFESLLVRNASRLAPAETGSHAYLNGVGMERVTTTGGSQIWSDPRMAVYRGWFAEQVRLHPGVGTLQLSADTSAIEGVGFADAESVLRGPRVREAIERALESLRGENGRSAQETAGTRLSELVSQLSTLAEIAAAGVRACEAPPSKRLAALEEVDRALHAHPWRDVAGFLAWHVLEDAGRTGSATIDESIQKSRRVYEAIESSAHYQLARARRLLARTVDQT